MSNELFEYDVAVSFAGEDRATAEKLARLLQARNLTVLFDEYSAATLGGSDFVTHIAEIYRTKARYCVLLLSQHYPLKEWTRAEQAGAQEHALRDANEYIIPVQLDSADVREHSVESIADSVAERAAQPRGHSGPPHQSHDLRSGNVPSTDP